MPCYCIAWPSHVPAWKLGATSLLVAVPRLGALGHYIFQVCNFRELYPRDAASRSLRCSRLTLEPHSVGRTPRGASGSPLAQAQRRRSLMDAVGQHAGAGWELGLMTPPWDSTLVLVRAMSQ